MKKHYTEIIVLSVLIIFALVLPPELTAQTEFDNFYKQAENALEKKQYEGAIKNFEAAKVTAKNNADIQKANEGIIRTQKARFDEVESAWEQAKEGEKRARLAENEARNSLEMAKKQEAEAKLQREKAEQKALEADANRLAFHASQELINLDTEYAEKLGFFAYRNTFPNVTPLAKRSFGDAVFAKRKKLLGDGSINAVDAIYSPYGRFLLVRKKYGQVSLWDAEKGEWIADMEDHEGPVYSMAFLDDENKFITGSADQRAIVWDKSGNKLDVLTGHTGEITGIVRAPGGSECITWSRDGTAIIRSKNGLSIGHLKAHDGPILEALYSPDGTYILTRGTDNKVCLWSKNGELIRNDFLHNNYIYDAQFSYDEKKVITASTDGKVKIWDVPGGKGTELSGTGLITAISVHPSRPLVVMGTRDGNVLIFDLNSGISREIEVARNYIVELLFNPVKEDWLAARCFNQQMFYIHLSGDSVSKPMRSDKAGISRMVFSPDGKYLLSASFDGIALLWDAHGDNSMTMVGDGSPVISAGFSPMGNQTFIITESGEVITSPLPENIYAELLENPPSMSADDMEIYSIDGNLADISIPRGQENSFYQIRLGVYKTNKLDFFEENKRKIKNYKSLQFLTEDHASKRDQIIEYITQIGSEKDAFDILKEAELAGFKDAYIIKVNPDGSTQRLN